MKIRSKGEKLGEAINLLILVLLALTCIVPFIVVISTSISDASRLAMKGASYVLWPEGVSFRVYKEILDKNSTIWPAYGVTIFRVVVGTLMPLATTLLTAYGLSKKDMPGCNFFTKLIFITMLFNGGLIPTYMVVNSLQLTNTLWVYVLPGMLTAWNFIVVRNFIMTQIPEALEEAAIIEGANPFQVLWYVVVPLSKPVLATIGLMCAVGQWNAWFDSAIYVTDKNLWPLQIILRNILSSASVQQLNPELLALYETQQLPPTSAYQCAVIMVSTLPILLIYPFLQKYFVKGMTVGAVKG